MEKNSINLLHVSLASIEASREERSPGEHFNPREINGSSEGSRAKVSFRRADLLDQLEYFKN